MLSLFSRFSTRIRIGILIGMVVLIVGGILLTTQRPNTAIPTVSYCDLIGDSKRYDQAIVRVRATYVGGFEWSYLMDNDCTGLTWTILVPEDPTCSVDLPKPLSPADDRTLTVTVVGRFYGERGGYGHMGRYPYEFDVVCIESASLFIPPWEWP